MARVCLIALLVQLCALTALGRHADGMDYTGGHEDYYYYEYDYPTDIPAEDDDYTNDWIYDYMDMSDECDPNPCLNGGTCDHDANGKFRCSCPEPYKGKKCQTVKDVCKNVKCGKGSCVITSTAPFYRCKCKPPYRPPNCNKASTCRPNPCQNGGSCIRLSTSARFQCACPDGYSGNFCEIAPNDCYQYDGTFYQGTVSETMEAKECLDWNSYFILRKGHDPMKVYAGDSGIGAHNYCRNPDGDDQPWCFFKEKGRLKWGYCNVRKCSGALPTAATTPAPIKPDVTAPQFSQCGTSQPRRWRIIGGKKSFPGANPWQVSLQTRPKNSSRSFQHICGGTLLQSCWVLTAAHCIGSDVEMQVVLGGVDLEKDEPYDQVIPVENAIMHQDYKETPFALYNDIALLKLKVMDRPYCAKETHFVKTACLPSQTFNNGTECVVSGWGVTEKQRYGTNQLQDVRVLLISQEKCVAPHVYGDTLDDSMFCAGNLQGGIDSCQGDSGGPLVCERNGTHYITGVVSWGDGCGKKYKPGVYANVGRFINWISNHLRS